MKRITAIIMALMMIISLCACGAKSADTGGQTAGDKKVENASSATDETAKNNNQEMDVASDTKESEKEGEAGEQPQSGMTAAEDEVSEEEQVQDDMDELAAIGDVEMENGILTVTITVPADLVGETTQESLDEGKGELYRSAVLNEDGSVTYKMTKAQHRTMLENIVSAVDESSQELIDDDENYSISAVTHNDDLTEFNVTIDGTEVGFGDYFTSYSFFMYGILYGKFRGKTPEHMVINFYDPDGNLIDSFDSADLEDSEGSGEAGDDEEYVNTGDNTY